MLVRMLQLHKNMKTLCSSYAYVAFDSIGEHLTFMLMSTMFSLNINISVRRRLMLMSWPSSLYAYASVLLQVRKMNSMHHKLHKNVLRTSVTRGNIKGTTDLTHLDICDLLLNR